MKPLAPIVSLDELRTVLVCPVPTCRTPMSIPDKGPIHCSACGHDYIRGEYAIDLTPKNWRGASELWQSWEVLQKNGQFTYERDPEANLGVGEREDCRLFREFCAYSGFVVDVGCGPQPWPSYYAKDRPQARFIGVDPLAPDSPSEYRRFRGLGEYLPFRDRSIDMVIFATSLDHMLSVQQTLREAIRVCRPGGQIVIWSGEKKPGAPRRAAAHDWYDQFERPPGAEDPFHFHRFWGDDVANICTEVGLHPSEIKENPIDEWRSDIFYRFKIS